MADLVLHEGEWADVGECVIKIDEATTGTFSARPYSWGDLDGSTITVFGGDVTAPEGVAHLDLATLKPVPAELLQRLPAGSAPAPELQEDEASAGEEPPPEDPWSGTAA